ncbi:MAG: type IIL restriction-modification enzyme MmeI, partial [Phycisphaerae bacterium]
RRAHDHLQPCTAANWHTGRAGLVGTQNIRNNQSRVGGLDHIVASGTIVEAVENMPWSGEANVHVSIANWVKNVKVSKPAAAAGSDAPTPMPGPGPSLKDRAAAKAAKAKAGTPPPGGGGFAKAAEEDGGQPDDDDDIARNMSPARRLWTKVEATAEFFEDDKEPKRPKTITLGKRGKVRKDKSYEMAARETAVISPSLSDEVDTTAAQQLVCNTEPQLVFQGQNPANDDFMISPQVAKLWLSQDRKLKAVLFPYMIGRDLVADGAPSRWVIDFGKRDMLEAAAFHAPFEHVKKKIMPAVLARAAQEKTDTGLANTRWSRMAERWWQFRDYQPSMINAIARLPRYIVCSRTTKRPIFAFIAKAIHPDTKLMVFAFADDYSFGVLQSAQHWDWFVTRCSKLTERFNYTPSSVFDTFPWPQSPTKKQIKAVAAAGREVRSVRAKVLPTMSGGLRALYRTLELPGSNPLKDAHAALDAAVMEAYGFSARKDLLKQLLDLNLSVAAAIARGQGVTAPGVPASYGDARDLVSDDCIEP